MVLVSVFGGQYGIIILLQVIIVKKLLSNYEYMYFLNLQLTSIKLITFIMQLKPILQTASTLGGNI